MNAKEFLNVSLGGNMNVGTLTPFAIEGLMEAYAKYRESDLQKKKKNNK